MRLPLEKRMPAGQRIDCLAEAESGRTVAVHVEWAVKRPHQKECILLL